MTTIEILKDTEDNRFKARIKGSQTLIESAETGAPASYSHLEVAMDSVKAKLKTQGIAARVDYVGEETYNARKKQWVEA